MSLLVKPESMLPTYIACAVLDAAQVSRSLDDAREFLRATSGALREARWDAIRCGSHVAVLDAEGARRAMIVEQAQ